MNDREIKNMTNTKWINKWKLAAFPEPRKRDEAFTCINKIVFRCTERWIVCGMRKLITFFSALLDNCCSESWLTSSFGISGQLIGKEESSASCYLMSQKLCPNKTPQWLERALKLRNSALRPPLKSFFCFRVSLPSEILNHLEKCEKSMVSEGRSHIAQNRRFSQEIE